MHVSEVLKKKGALFTIKPDATCGEAARRFKYHKISALPVRADDGPVQGLITERDIMHAIAGHGPCVLDMPVSQFMSQTVFSCTPEDTLHQITHLMVVNHVRHLLVSVDGDVQGIVSKGDILRNQLDETELEVNVMRDCVRVMSLRP
ncbi:MAG: CBS domain-containing protein [Alphaproteobacteria bacterium]|nr:CBS domain-containing protein [Alphaproteobacteria bacterium]